MTACKSSQEIFRPEIWEAPRIYVAQKTDDSIEIDGKPYEKIWSQVEWSDAFIDITGNPDKVPEYETRFKMCWNNERLFLLAYLEEPHVWATLRDHDAVIYQDDDFELFLDPDGDSHHYTEIEINAFNTIWDLFLTAPYTAYRRDKVLWKWNIVNLKSAVQVMGSINYPADTDQGWMIEMEIPLEVLEEFSNGHEARSGNFWRINFSRVDWQVKIRDGTYEKKKDENGKTLPENNWVWSSQGMVNMHIPARWGYLYFSENNEIDSSLMKAELEDFRTKAWLTQAQSFLKARKRENGHFPKKFPRHLLPQDWCIIVEKYEPYSEGFLLSAKNCQRRKVWSINEEGRLHEKPSSFH